MELVTKAIALIEKYNYDCLDRHPDERIGWDSECEHALNKFINTQFDKLTPAQQEDALNTIIEMNLGHDDFICDLIGKAFAYAPKCKSAQDVYKSLLSYAVSSPFSKCSVGDVKKHYIYKLKEYFDKFKNCEEVIYTLDEIQEQIESANMLNNDTLYKLLMKLKKQLTSSIFYCDEEENK